MIPLRWLCFFKMKNNIYILVILIIYITAASASRATKNYKKQFSENNVDKSGSDDEYLFTKSKPKKDIHVKDDLKVNDIEIKKSEAKKSNVPVFECILILIVIIYIDKKPNIRNAAAEESTDTDEDLTKSDETFGTTAIDESGPTEEGGGGGDDDGDATEKELTDEEEEQTPTPIPDVPLIPIKPNIYYVIDEDTLRNCINQENATQCVLLNDIEINNNDKSQWIVTSTFEGSINGRNNKIIFNDPLSKSGFISKLNYTEIKDITFVFVSSENYEIKESEVVEENEEEGNGKQYSGILFNQIVNSRINNVEIIFNQTTTTSTDSIKINIKNTINFGIVAGNAISTEFNRVTIDFITSLEVNSETGGSLRNRRNINEENNSNNVYNGLLLGNGKKVNILNSYVRINQLKVNIINFGVMVGECDDCEITKSYTQTSMFEIDETTSSNNNYYSGIISNSINTLIHNSFTIIIGLKYFTNNIIFGGIMGKASLNSKITASYIDIRLNDTVGSNLYGFIGYNNDTSIEMLNCRGFIKNAQGKISGYINSNNNKEMKVTKLLIDLKNPTACEDSKLSSKNQYSDVYIYECDKYKLSGIISVSSRNISSSTFPGLDFSSLGYYKIFNKEGNIIYSNNNNIESATITRTRRVLVDRTTTTTATAIDNEEQESDLFVGLSRLPNTIPTKDNIVFTKVASSKYEVDGDCWDSDIWSVNENGELIISREPEKRIFEIPITGLYPILKDNNKNSRCEKNCNNHGICRRNECICINNWTGKNCDLKKCSYGNYHFNNTYNIVMECSGIGKCDRKEGKCVCPQKIVESGNEIEVSYVTADSNVTNCEYIYSNI